MNLFSIILIAIGLSMDTLAVSVSNGITISKLQTIKVIKIAFVMSFFQGIMPLAGWYAGIELKPIIEAFDHWLAFILLFVIGIKMIFDAFFKDGPNKQTALSRVSIISQSIATSIDALVIGISFALVGVSIIVPVIIIGAITFFVSAAGLIFGKYFQNHTSKNFEFAGGIILILIGFKILVEHIYFI